MPNMPAAHSESVGLNREQRTSPAPPSRPINLSPGIRASLLQKVFDDALSHTVKVCSFSNFAACFPTPARHVSEAIDGLHRNFVARLDEVCKSEFAALMDERDVVSSLNELDNLIGDAKKRKERAVGTASGEAGACPFPTPPHLLSPSALLAAHMTPFLSMQTNSLNEQLASFQKSNNSLAKDVAAQRNTVSQLVKGLEHIISDLEAACVALQTNGADAEVTLVAS